jgi:phospholipid/cholesterol/gamma-HCH transport system ATP-binding protein
MPVAEASTTPAMEAPPGPESVLRYENVTVRFDDVTAVDNVSLDVRRGQTCIFFGAAGSGKSVLFKAAMGLVPLASGRIFLFDEDISGLSEQDMYLVRSRVGMAFQESALFDSMTIAQNVAYPLLNHPSLHSKPEEARAKVKQALEFVELGGTLDKYPSELSGGMRRRAAIARAVVTKPPLLLYDSPTAGLDPITSQTIVALILKERDLDNTTALVITHRYQDGNLVANFRYNPESGSLEQQHHGASKEAASTRFMVMRDGRLIFDGGQDQIEASADPYIGKFVKHPD